MNRPILGRDIVVSWADDMPALVRNSTGEVIFYLSERTANIQTDTDGAVKVIVEFVAVDKEK